ncbi:MAG: hypothetical protein IT427_06215 [Pirellulales bacterium]|nr:hypothetical protein [Pirellulales bacterium]
MKPRFALPMDRRHRWHASHRRREQRTVSQDINVLALVKGGERYIFLYDDDNRAETLRTLGRYASNPELSFTWYDAAVLSQKIRQSVETTTVKPRRFSLPLPSDAEES